MKLLVTRQFPATLDQSWLPALDSALVERRLLKKPVSIVFVSPAAMRKLNRAYRGKDKATNVLSFALGQRTDPDEAFGGEIILCYPKLVQSARSRRHSIDDECKLLIVHSIFHLKGYDHATNRDAKIMERREEQVLTALTAALAKR